jgi:hypothetical protein
VFAKCFKSLQPYVFFKRKDCEKMENPIFAKSAFFEKSAIIGQRSESKTKNSFDVSHL